MHIKGWVKSTLLDYPGRVAASLFCGGCNLCCPHCHNRDLVLSPHTLPDIPEAEIWPFLRKRRGLLDGVVISGGEPTLQPDLPTFARHIHELGFLVKLDTNGGRPDVVMDMIQAGLVDYVAMDIKAPLAKYGLVAGAVVNTDLIQRSIALLLQGRIEYEFRTTVVPDLLDKEDIAQIGKLIDGSKRYFLQQFVPHNTIDPRMLKLMPYRPEQLQEMAALVRPYVGEVQVRGA